MLDLWYQSLPRWYTVKAFMVDVHQWYKEGYIDREVWNHLQKYVQKDVQPVSVSDVTVTSGNMVVTATCSFSSSEGIYLLILYILFLKVCLFDTIIILYSSFIKYLKDKVKMILVVSKAN